MRKRKNLIFKDNEEKLKILLINPFGIGDVLFSTPLLRILKDNFPNSSICFICNKRTRETIEKSPDIDEVFVFEKDDYKALWKNNKIACLKEFISFIGKIKNRAFDLAIDMSMGHQYNFFLKLMCVPVRAGFDYKGRGRFLTEKLNFDGFEDRPIGEYYKELLRMLEFSVKDAPTRIWLTDEDRSYADEFCNKKGLKTDDIIIGIAPGGGISFGREKLNFKRWPAEKFSALIKGLINDINAKIILLWGPGEEYLIEEVVDRIQLPKSSSMRPIIAPRTSIRQLAAFMEKCDCVVANDAGPLHVAVASGAKTVSIFGPSDENVYGPYPKGPRHKTVTGSMACRPCYKKFKIPDCMTLDCLNTLEWDKVLEAVKACIER